MDSIDERRFLQAKRQSLSLWLNPITTLTNFAIVATRGLRVAAAYVAQHPVMTYGVLPVLIAYVTLLFVPGNHHAFLDTFEAMVEFTVWWVGLGVLSSVGLGTGMHTGVLFLFPYIFKICLASMECGSTQFDSVSDMWFRDSSTAFVCLDAQADDSVGVPFMNVWLKAMPAAFLWGAGTAMGEIPPYLVSRAAALAGQADEDFEELMDSKSSWSVLNRMKEWMIDFLSKHGFVGVLLMASWPNMAFDLCGICCGHFLMPFWSFFGATFIGKACIKVTAQAAFFVLLFSQGGLERIVSLVDALIPDAVEPCLHIAGKECHIIVSDLLTKAKHTFSPHGSDDANTQQEVGWLKWGWSVVMILFIAYFVVTCVEQFARMRQKEVDEEKLRRKGL